MTLPTHYLRSGRVAWHAPLKLLLIGGPGAALLAAVYTLIVRWNPLIWFTCIATVGFGVLLGLAATMACTAGQSRSRAFNAFAGLVVGAFGLWCHWIFWTWLMFSDGGESARHLAASGPHGWEAFLDYTAENRHLTIGRLAHNGAEVGPTFLAWTWGAEALAVLLLSTLSATLGESAFSEVTKQWAVDDWKGDLWPDPATSLDAAATERLFKEQGVAWLLPLAEAARQRDEKAPGVRLRLTCASVADDPTCRFVSVEQVTQRGPKDRTSVTLATMRRVDAAAYKRLLAALKRGDASAPPAPVPDNSGGPARRWPD